MKPLSPDVQSTPPQPTSPLKRRGVLLGAGGAVAAGALAAVAARGTAAIEAEPAVAAAREDASAGYRPSPHVLRYYETTRV